MLPRPSLKEPQGTPSSFSIASLARVPDSEYKKALVNIAELSIQRRS